MFPTPDQAKIGGNRFAPTKLNSDYPFSIYFLRKAQPDL
jgi:hypothetical protein